MRGGKGGGGGKGDGGGGREWCMVRVGEMRYWRGRRGMHGGAGETDRFFAGGVGSMLMLQIRYIR